MKISAHAFAQMYPKDLAPGSLFRLRGRWALRVSSDDIPQGFLMLEGERVGEVFALTAGVAQVVAIMQPFGWFPTVSSEAEPSLEPEWTAVLALTGSGPVVVGSDARDDWDPTFLAFNTNGVGADAQDLHRAMRFGQWSIELCHVDRPYTSLGTLLQVDRRLNGAA